MASRIKGIAVEIGGDTSGLKNDRQEKISYFFPQSAYILEKCCVSHCRIDINCHFPFFCHK